MMVSYRSLFMVLLLIAIAAYATTYMFFPSLGVRAYTQKALIKLGVAAVQKTEALIGPQEAHFTALDGTVRVKKSNSNNWVAADFGVPLEKGDVVQTSSQGMAKVFFPEGTNYTIKPDSLIVIEENSANEQQQTQVAVQVTTGTVDLNTATYTQGSISQVIVAGATAALAPESSAMVHNDPRADTHEILVKKGSGRVTRNNQTIVLSDYEKVSFRAAAPQMSRTKETGPPTLIQPANMQVTYVSAAWKPVHFSWTPTGSSGNYRLRVSLNPYFSSMVFDKVISGTEFDAPLAEGSYYWVVTAQDANGHESAESERNQFTLVVRAPDAASVPLELEPFTQHGHVIEVKGKTDPTARVMVNGREVPLIRADGQFSFFTPPLPNGENVITVTAQNARGGVKTQQKKVVIE
jgi:hypothetical protein